MIVWRLGGKIFWTVLCCIMYDTCAEWCAHTCEQFFNLRVGFGLDFVFVFVLSLLFIYFCVCLDHFIPVLLAFVVLGLVSSVPIQELVWEERLRDDLFCVEWDLSLNRSILHFWKDSWNYKPRNAYHDNAYRISTFITGPPNGPVLFCSLVSVVVCNAAGGRAWRVGGRPPPGTWAADTARRASAVTSRYDDTLFNQLFRRH